MTDRFGARKGAGDSIQSMGRFISARLFAGLALLRKKKDSTKMGLRWWRDVLIRSQMKRYVDNREARNSWFVSFLRLRAAASNGLKIGCP